MRRSESRVYQARCDRAEAKKGISDAAVPG
jgi:hypothetical protein